MEDAVGHAEGDCQSDAAPYEKGGTRTDPPAASRGCGGLGFDIRSNHLGHWLVVVHRHHPDLIELLLHPFYEKPSMVSRIADYRSLELEVRLAHGWRVEAADRALSRS